MSTSGKSFEELPDGVKDTGNWKSKDQIAQCGELALDVWRVWMRRKADYRMKEGWTELRIHTWKTKKETVEGYTFWWASDWLWRSGWNWLRIVPNCGLLYVALCRYLQCAVITRGKETTWGVNDTATREHWVERVSHSPAPAQIGTCRRFPLTLRHPPAVSSSCEGVLGQWGKGTSIAHRPAVGQQVCFVAAVTGFEPRQIAWYSFVSNNNNNNNNRYNKTALVILQFLWRTTFPKLRQRKLQNKETLPWKSKNIRKLNNISIYPLVISAEWMVFRNFPKYL